MGILTSSPCRTPALRQVPPTASRSSTACSRSFLTSCPVISVISRSTPVLPVRGVMSEKWVIPTQEPSYIGEGGREKENY